SLVTLPAYLLARRLFGVQAALMTLFILAVTPGLCGWLGRNIYLELPLNVLLYFAVALMVCVPSRPAYLAAGALLGFGYLIKETAITLGLGILLVLFWMERLPGADEAEKEACQRPGWIFFAAGFVPVCLGMIVALCAIPHYWRDCFLLNYLDPYEW